METNFITGFGPNCVPVGKLHALQSVGARFKQARGLPGNLPVLTCPIRQEDRRMFGPSYENTNLGFGCIDLEDGSKLQTIRFQMEDLQFYWVADIVDPVMWAAIDVWRIVGRFPFLFYMQNGDTWDATFSVVNAPFGSLRNEAFRRGANVAPSAATATELLSLVASGSLQAGATSDIPGVPLRHVFVNALVTEWAKDVVHQVAKASIEEGTYA
ncbi:hypothetical protein [Cupriavidus sp. D384]|uniref:hypothetical protein n=1 Tax=Cupriavidus sp. D384 TaxID=1538095 RepID=UPI0008367413|nr:hypothetical protein [Cupriavidus sp. D384]